MNAVEKCCTGMCLGALLAFGCGRSELTVLRPASDAGTPDAAMVDSGPRGKHDAGPPDGGRDAGPTTSFDAGPTRPPDAGSPDAGLLMCPPAVTETKDTALRTQWKRALGTEHGVPKDIALDGSGNAYVVGRSFEAGSVDGGTNAFVAKLDVDGDLVWTRSYGDAGVQSATSVAIDPNGAVIIAGVFSSAVDFGAGELDDLDGGAPEQLTTAGEALFVAKLDLDGSAIWSRVVSADPSSQTYSGASVAVDALGRIVLVGNVLSSAAVADERKWYGFAQALDADGLELWRHRWAGARASAVAIDPARAAIIAGSFEASTIDLSGADEELDAGTSAALDSFADTQSMWLLKLDAAGTYVWSTEYHALEGSKEEIVADLAIDRVTNEIYLGGSTTADVRLARDGFLAKFDPLGAPLWTRRFDGGNGQLVTGLAIDAYGITLTGSYEGYLSISTTDSHTPLLGPDQSPQWFAARLRSNAEVLWAGKLGGRQIEFGSTVAVNAARNQIVIAGIEGAKLESKAPPSGAGNVTDIGVYHSPMTVIAVDGAEPTRPLPGRDPSTAPASIGWYEELPNTFGLPANFVIALRVHVGHPRMLVGFGWVARPDTDDTFGGLATETVFGLYADTWDGTEMRPGELLAQTVAQTNAEEGRVEVGADECVELAPGYYWVAVTLRSARAVAIGSFDVAPSAWASAWPVDAGANLTSFPESAYYTAAPAINVYALMR